MLGKDLNSATIAAKLRRFSNLLHPHQWLQAYFYFGYLLFCLVNVWFVVGYSGPYLSLGNASRSGGHKTPGIVKNHLNLIEKTVAIGGPEPSLHPEITSLCYGHLWFVRDKPLVVRV